MSKKAVTAKKPIRTHLHADDSSFLQTDANGIVISASESLAKHTGFAAKNLIGTSLMDIVAKNDKSKLSSFFKKEKTPGLNEITISLKGEKRNRSFRFSVQCISGARHRYLLNWNVNSKPSVNTHKNDSPTLQGNIFDQVFQPVLMFTPSDNKIAYANTAAFEAFNFTDKDIGQICLQDLVDPFQTTKSKKKENSFTRHLRIYKEK